MAGDTAIQEAVDAHARQARLQVEMRFFKLLTWLPHASFHLMRPEAGEFVIGDSPTVLHEPGSQQFGGIFQMGIQQATNIVMPLGPQLAVTVVLDGGACFVAGPMSEAGVRLVNEMQVRTALKHVFYRPGAMRREFVRGVLREAISG
ncbi:DUF4238 domain-containing protein [Pseudofrankia sp. BMG5.36]|uniref:DUF4238 domain-containing protein n=1 Tax=Pseudofrankia sp. BMG5.36 TaxID=1834512 RepID=UPI0008DB1543|nr:DUF4238 domain-containing protein [Pseudofrankia sp. BMG5.36]OHV61406.1 hypothetical protein BCD48_39770 [Pseudofrankia sp. BMG5.36]